MGVAAAVGGAVVAPDSPAVQWALLLAAPVVTVVVLRRLRARVAHAVLRGTVGKGDLPPDTAVPASSAFAERWTRLSPDTAGDLVTDDFTGTSAGRTLGRRRWLRAVRSAFGLYPDTRVELHEVRVDPAAPAVLWLRTTQRATPRHGPVLDIDAWERLELDAAGTRAVSYGVRIERVG